MSDIAMKIIRVDAGGMDSILTDLAAILVDAVTGGASVSFLLPFGADDAQRYWRGVKRKVDSGETLLFAALSGGTAVGTVQLVPAVPPNQAHRADVAKLLVRSDHRNRGVARALMAQLEREALSLGRTLLTLDTISGSAAERLYLALGYTLTGRIPGYARMPSGPLAPTSVLYKQLTDKTS
jgi:GNAT superfamily N-acetyltransferase